MKTVSKRSVAGSGLLAVLFTMAIVAALVAAVFSATNSQVAATKRTTSRATALAYADGVVESLFDQWRNAMISVTNTTDRANGLSNTSLAATLAAPTAATLPVPAGVTLGAWSVVACTPLITTTTDAGGRPTPENGTSSSLRVRLHYLATVNVTFAATSGFRTVTLQRTFVRAGRNLFDNFFFGTQPNIEFHPGPPMYVSGTSYIGGNLFTAHDSLHYTKDVTFTGSQTIGYHPLDSRYGNYADIQNGGLGDNWDINNPPHYGSQQKLFDTPVSSLEGRFLDHPSNNDTSTDGNNNNDGYREIIEEQNTVTAANPDPLQLDSSTSERLSQTADYRIYVNAANVVSIYKGTSTVDLAGSAPAEYTAIRNALTTNTAMRDVREGDNVRVVAIDVGTVRTAYNASTITDNVGGGDGLLFYVADTSVGTSVNTKIVNSSTAATTNVTSSRQRGVKLVNGAQLPGAGSTGLAKGFSVVTPNPVYIQGDYNTGKTSTSNPPSNTASSYTPPTDNPNPYVTGYDRVPAAVAGDAVNILSNNWNDANSSAALGSRSATNTTINTAIIAGNVPTGTSGSYSGGIENFTRFHEEWGGDYLTIYGALALLFDSSQATGPWSTASYSPPNRRWYYDTLLQDNNPPGFRVARTYERGRWVQR